MSLSMHRVTALGLLLAACAPAGNTVTEADLDAIRAGRTAFVEGMRAGNIPAVAALYSENAVVMPPNGPVTLGRLAVEQLMAGFPPIGEFQFASEELTPLGGDAVLVTGRYMLTMLPPGLDMAVADTGKFVEVWQREASGWKLRWDAWNTDLPLPEPAPPAAAPAGR